MTVLLVDDQIHILSGLISGLDWNALGVTSILTAESARKAREILEREPVDILLCDIEMPRENGLSLLRWARAQGIRLRLSDLPRGFPVRPGGHAAELL